MSSLQSVAADLEYQLDEIKNRIGRLEAAQRSGLEFCGPSQGPAAPMPFEGDTMTHEDAPSPAASLVERMAEAMFNAHHINDGFLWANAAGVVKDEYRREARAALRVAAEGLLGDVTERERTAIAARCDALGATEDVLRCRLAAALEACR